MKTSTLTNFQQNQWKGYNFPPELSHISTKNPTAFLLNSELVDIENYLQVQGEKLRCLKQKVGYPLDEEEAKALEKWGQKLRYNEALLSRKEIGVLGKREDERVWTDLYEEWGLEKEETRPKDDGRASAFRKYDPRDRGMMRLGEHFAAQTDLQKLLFCFLGDKYQTALDNLEQQLNEGHIPDSFPTEEFIQEQVNELLKNKKMQDRITKMIENMQKTVVDTQLIQDQQTQLSRMVSTFQKVLQTKSFSSAAFP